MGIVYSITNRVNQKVYIGRSLNSFDQRYPGGKWWHYTHSKHLKDAVARYGVEAFVVSILHVTENAEELAKAETDAIAQFDAANREKGYNVLVAEVNYHQANETKRLAPDEVKAIRFQTKSQAQSAAWKRKSTQEMAEINARRSVTLKKKSDPLDYSARVAKRLARSDEDKEKAEVKRLWNKLGPSWRPNSKSSWFGRYDRFLEIARELGLVTLVAANLPIVYLIAGQCGVGKTTLCRELGITTVNWDTQREDFYSTIKDALSAGKPITVDVPLRSKQHRRNIVEKLGCTVKYIVVRESPDIVRARLASRGSTRTSAVDRLYAKYTRYAKMADFSGNYDECLSWLRRELGLV